MMLTIPASPSPSYLAPGVVITSILFISSAGINCRAVEISELKKADVFPLIKNLIFFDPLKLTFPSRSTESRGVFLNTSVASSEVCSISFCGLYTILSILFS